jgi:hypothetical protein
MRALAVATAALALSGSAAGGGSGTRVAFLHGGNLVVLEFATHSQRVVLKDAGNGAVHWSGDGQLLSVGGRVVGGPAFPTSDLTWAPSGERLAYVTRETGVVAWSPRAGRRTVAPPGWGATSVAWGSDGALALGRVVCHVPCGLPRHEEVWIWQANRFRRVAGPLRGDVRPIVAGFAPGGRALWWADPNSSGSIAADGLALYANRTRVATTLVFPDYVVRCGPHLALAVGTDRYATHGKRILFDGRDVSRDRAKSWVSPSCSGSTLVAAAGRNWQETYIGRGERRAIWQLLPARRQLTHPPAGSTDENPHVLGDGSILFVRTHETARKVDGQWYTTEYAELELLAGGKLSALADVGFTAGELSGLLYDTNYYGHYGWPWRIAVAP